MLTLQPRYKHECFRHNPLNLGTVCWALRLNSAIAQLDSCDSEWSAVLCNSCFWKMKSDWHINVLHAYMATEGAVLPNHGATDKLAVHSVRSLGLVVAQVGCSQVSKDAHVTRA